MLARRLSHSISVEVLDPDGEPVKSAKVSVHISGLWKGGNLEPDFTDDTGHAEFQTAEDYEDSRELHIP